jgi:hypothetical protein
MGVRTIILVGGTIFYDALCPLGHSQTQRSSEATWSLPHGLALKDAGRARTSSLWTTTRQAAEATFFSASASQRNTLVGYRAERSRGGT